MEQRGPRATGAGRGGTRRYETPTGIAMPPTHSRMANLSLALGAAGVLLGFLLMFAVLTPAAIIAAIAALREIRVQPALLGRGRAWAGIALAVAAPVLWVSAFLAFSENGTFGLF